MASRFRSRRQLGGHAQPARQHGRSSFGRCRLTKLTARQLNRTTLSRQLLLQREQLGVVDAVRRVIALQAQEPASPYVALWNRVEGFRPDDLDQAFADHGIIKATLMRITLHAVAADDYSPFQRAMVRNLRASRLNDRRFKSTGMTSDDADELVPDVLGFCSEPRTRTEIEAMLADRISAEPDKHIFWALRTYAPLLHAPTGGAWSYTVNAPTYQAAPLDRGWDDPVTALQELIWRYLEGFGPASPADFAQFALQRQAEIRPALAAMSDRLVTHDGPAGPLLDTPGGDGTSSSAITPPGVSSSGPAGPSWVASRSLIAASAGRISACRWSANWAKSAGEAGPKPSR